MGDEFDALVASWTIDLRSRQKSTNTVRIYTGAANAFARELRTQGLTGWGDVGRAEIRGYFAGMADRTTSGNASVNWRSVQQLFKWLAEEEEIDANPMAEMSGPKAKPKPVPVVGDDDLKRLLVSLSGRDFIDRRDNAVLRVLLDTGIRRAECAGMTIPGVDLVHREAVVTGKGDRTRTVRFGFNTAKAIDRYLRVRSQHVIAERSDALWLAPRRHSPLTATGIGQLVKRRGEAVGLHLHPHKFRHTFAHLWLDQGGAEGDLMEMTGWTSRQMLDRYGASARNARALRSYDRLVIGDRF